MRGRDQWVLIQSVIDHLGRVVHASFPIAEHMMDLEWPKDARNCRECWSALLVSKLVDDRIVVDPGQGHFLLVGWLC
jgi:hypothetical protein